MQIGKTRTCWLLRSIVLFSLLFIQACQRHQVLPSALENYSQRMYQVLELEPKEIYSPPTLSFPDKSTLKLEVPKLNIQMREFYAIEDCAIKQLIAQRNTALGKIQLPSVRLGYEWQLIRLLQSCIKNSAEHEQSAELEKMQDWLTQKESIYPLNWANMLTQSTELYLGLSASPGFIDGNANDNFTQGLFDLKNLIGMKLAPEVNFAEMETSLQSIQEHRIFARLWRSQLLLNSYLAEMTVDITEWAETASCKTRKDKEKFKIIRNVFNLFFVQEIQAIGSQINHYQYSLKPELLKLIKDPDLPPEFGEALAKYSQVEFDSYQGTMREHVKMWQTIFGLCDKDL